MTQSKLDALADARTLEAFCRTPVTWRRSDAEAAVSRACWEGEGATYTMTYRGSSPGVDPAALAYEQARRAATAAFAGVPLLRD